MNKIFFTIIMAIICLPIVWAGTINVANVVIHNGRKWEVIETDNGPTLLRYQVPNGWIYTTSNNWCNIAFVPS